MHFYFGTFFREFFRGAENIKKEVKKWKRVRGVEKVRFHISLLARPFPGLSERRMRKPVDLLGLLDSDSDSGIY